MQYDHNLKNTGILRMQRICAFYVECKEWVRLVRTGDKNTLQCHSLASFCYDSFHWSDSHAAFVMAKYSALTNRAALYPI